jgi:glyoxylase-like metal-dependent hydrolase (beta-lactamase superfamily II)
MVNHYVRNKETFYIGGIKVTGSCVLGSTLTIGLHTPCHTQDSVSYFLEHEGSRAVFTGDTLFIAGSGRFFEVIFPLLP